MAKPSSVLNFSAANDAGDKARPRMVKIKQSFLTPPAYPPPVRVAKDYSLADDGFGFRATLPRISRNVFQIALSRGFGEAHTNRY